VRSRNQEDELPDATSEEDVNINLAKCLLESIQSQAGLPGPGGTLLGMMGMRISPDDRQS
jgi:hypothetical protein